MIRRKVISFFTAFTLFVAALVLLQLVVVADPTPSTGFSIASGHSLVTGSFKPLFGFAALFIFLIVLTRLPRNRSMPRRFAVRVPNV